MMLRNEKKFRGCPNHANWQPNPLHRVIRHDINNQLTPLTGYLEILEGSQLDPPLNKYILKATTTA